MEGGCTRRESRLTIPSWTTRFRPHLNPSSSQGKALVYTAPLPCAHPPISHTIPPTLLPIPSHLMTHPTYLPPPPIANVISNHPASHRQPHLLPSPSPASSTHLPSPHLPPHLRLSLTPPPPIPPSHITPPHLLSGSSKYEPGRGTAEVVHEVWTRRHPKPQRLREVPTPCSPSIPLASSLESNEGAEESSQREVDQGDAMENLSASARVVVDEQARRLRDKSVGRLGCGGSGRGKAL